MDFFLSFLIWLFGADAQAYDSPNPYHMPSTATESDHSPQMRGDLNDPSDNSYYRLQKEIIIVVEDTHFKPGKGK